MKKKLNSNRMFAKIRSKAGETLTETLVALVIGTLSLAMLASMIGSTTKIIGKTENILEDYYTTSALVATHKEYSADEEDETVHIHKVHGNATISAGSGSETFNLYGDTASSPVYLYSFSTTVGSKTISITSYERRTGK